ncbi:uncharacterized protein TNCV_4783861 [Trichonephila clavipes]|nr:uncharacterized protein TNCV_4783861 [Trichonephila clavipes]
MAPHVKGAPAALVTNQAKQFNLPNLPPTVNFNNNGTFDMNFITQTLQQTILALSMLTQHIEKYSPDIILVQEAKLRPIHNIRIANCTSYRNDCVADGHAAGGGTLILIKNSINHFNPPIPQLQYSEATIVTINPPNFNPLTIISIYIPPSSDNRLFTLDIEILRTVGMNEVHCKMCNSGLDMQVLKGKSGLAITFVLKCFACPYRVEFSSSNFHEGTQIATINTRFVYAMRSIGKGAEAGRMFCGVMNLPQPPTRFAPYAVAVDGTWQKRGYTSLNGVVTVTSIDTGKVIDVDILSKYCACKNLPFHEKDCKRNYVGSSGAMEIQGASKIFQRSLSLHNARYITYLGDGDCKANEYPIEKLECIGHVMKRMGTRLHRLKAQLKGQILSDGKCLSGKNRLTEHEIDNLQSYYGSAIRRNHSSVQNMRQAIWAIFLHKLSTDEYPQHGFCPIGEDSWCGFKKAEASGKSYKHKNSLPVAVVEAMRPIFRDLSHPDLLKKCLHGKTQNPNESFHNVVWSGVPKATFVQIETLSLGVYDAVCSFNDGNVSKLKMLQKMGVEPGEFSVSAMKLLDRERLMKAIYAFSGRSKKIRKDKRRKRKKEEDNIKKNKRLSTSHPLLRLTEKIAFGFQRGRSTGAVFLDIQKAFDRVWIGGLIYKLIINNFPFALIHIINSYLTNRSYQVRVKDSLSNVYNVNIGALQGNLLGPIIFNIYINDIPTHPQTSLNIYADDTAIATTYKNHKYITKQLNNHLMLLEI